jgi:hypothetical protein
MLESLVMALREEGGEAVMTDQYRGASGLLVLYGVGAPMCSDARERHLSAGGRVVIWDVGYLVRKALRFSIDRDHPLPDWLDSTQEDCDRFDEEHISLRNDFNSAGPIVLVAVGPKSHAYLGASVDNWEQQKFSELQSRFPSRQIIYRPKPRRAAPSLPCPRDDRDSIEDVLRGASLMVCRHSNVAVDAAIAGIPFECEDGIARWLAQREFTIKNRLQFLRKVAWWQWRTHEAAAAWSFVNKMLTVTKKEEQYAT